MSLSDKLDTGFKALSLISTLIVVPTFTWVWQAQGQIQKLETQMESAEKEIEEMQANTIEIELLKRDLIHHQEKLTQIRDMLLRGIP